MNTLPPAPSTGDGRQVACLVGGLVVGGFWLEIRRWGWLATLLVAATGCTTLRMAVPPDIEATSDTFQARGRSGRTGAWVNESFQLGPYAVAKVDRDGTRTRGSGFALFGIESSKEDIRDGYSFQFEEGAWQSPGQCRSLTRRKGWSIGNLSMTSEEARLVCACGNGEDEVNLEIVYLGGRPTGGTVFVPRGKLGVSPVNETVPRLLMGMLSGYRVDGGGEPLAAVEILPPGRIWLSRSLDDVERRQIGCLLVALMLYVEPSEPI